MSIETWLAFTAASAILLVIPGPTILLVVSYALGQGWRAALPMAVGTALGDFTALTVSVLGLGAVLAASATLFVALKWVGAAYLVYLGVKLWKAGGTLQAEPRRDGVATTRMVAHAWLVTALNPKSIVFFVAFLPQFVDPARGFAVQVVTLEATFLTLSFLNAIAYAVVASQARSVFPDPRAVAVMNRAGGTLLIGAAVATVTMRSARP